MRHIYDYVTEYARSNPEKAALADSNGVITYGELDRRSGMLAAKLVSAGITPGDPVGVYVPYVKEIALGGVSAVRAGGVYVPLDDSYPKDRLNFMLTDSGAKAILTLHCLWEKAPLDFPENRVVFMDDEYMVPPFTAQDIPMDASAFILYTSGTTGRPKGVVHSHLMMVSFLEWASIHEGTDVTENSRTAAMTGFTFIGSTEILYSALCKGATAYVVPETARKDIAALYGFICREGITHTFMPSSFAATFVEYCDTSKVCIFAGGEKMRNFRPVSPDTLLINSYGATELAGVISARVRGDETVIPTGYLAKDTRYMILDENGCPVADNEAGELLVTNERMSRHYLNLPEQNEKNWIRRDGELWFRTGDRARRTADGVFTILGRTDNMVKLRGFRIETGEVEAQIAAVLAASGSEVENIAVVLRTVNGIDHLVCYYESPSEMDTETVTAGIAETLTSYMIPDIWVRMDAMPRNTNGKILRAKLPQPESRVSAPGTVFSEAEARVVEAAAMTLGIRNYVSPDDSFAGLGGTSLKAMELAVNLRGAGINIDGSEILKLDTLRAVAAEAEIEYERFWTAEENEQVRKDFASRGEIIEKVLPVTAAQDEALFEQIIHPDKRGSRRVFMFQTDSFLEESEIRSALDTVSKEFETLRSALVYHRVRVIQQVIAGRGIPLRMEELPGGDIAGVKEIFHVLSTRPCDLQRESRVQAVCAHAGDESFLFLLDYMAGLDMPSTRKFIARIIEILGSFHPEDNALAEWKNIFEMNPGEERAPAAEHTGERLRKESEARSRTEEAIHVYSENSGKKIVFVHTGNTGSEAYYSLAARIRNDFSFAVIEPFNLYHPDEAIYGIPNIAARYVKTLLEYQPEGPYILGGWCYGGVVAQEMACQLQSAGKEVELLIMLDSHVILDEKARKASEAMTAAADRDYFETCPVFEEQRSRGMLEALIDNSRYVGYDMMTHSPSCFDGPVLYFKPEVIPAASRGGAREYWNLMMKYDAGGYENYCRKDMLTVIDTPHEHDLMMDEESLDIIVPNIYRKIMPERT